MEGLVSSIIKWIKLQPTYLFALFIISVFLAFADSSILAIFSLNGIISTYRWVAGLVFLSTGVLLFVHLCLKIISFIRKQICEINKLHNLQNYLHDLTVEEKTILKRYIESNTKTQYLDRENGITRGLEIHKIIYDASSSGTSLNSWPYNIQPWVWRYLNRHPRLLE